MSDAQSLTIVMRKAHHGDFRFFLVSGAERIVEISRNAIRISGFLFINLGQDFI